MLTCGIHDGHNAAAALMCEGRILSALQEERLSRIKNWHGFPIRSIEAQLESIGAAWSDVHAYVFGGHEYYRGPGAPGDRVAQMHAYKSNASLHAMPRRWLRHTSLRALTHRHRGVERRRYLRARGVPNERIVTIEHHRCHAMTAYYGAAAAQDVLVITLDGAGDGVCATVAVPDKDGTLRRVCAVAEEHSIGILWATVTALMGMVPNEHEYKMMGMAPYAVGSSVRAAADMFHRAHRLVDGSWKRTSGVPEASYAYAYWRDALEFIRFDAICAGLQLFTEEFVCEWVQHWVRKTGLKKLRLSGGVFMNVKLNKALMELPDVEDIYIFPSCGDETNAIGACWAHYEDRGLARQIQPLGPLYLGLAPSAEQYDAAAEVARSAGCTVTRPSDLADEVTKLLVAGNIVARLAGREEFGARALGNRSILADPSRKDVVKTINGAIKSRDFWMPFACSMMEEVADEFLNNPKHISAPYMIMTFEARQPEKIIAGCHPEDYSVRPQTVSRQWNCDYHEILSKFREKTDRGVLLNTSFNMHGEPIVSKPAEGVDVLLRSGLQHLCLGPYLITKSLPV